MSKADERETAEELLRNVLGNAPTDTKEFVQRMLYTPMSNGFGTQTTRRLDLVEVSIVPNVDEPAKQEARVVLEIVVTEDMVNGFGTIHGACILHLVDVCTTLPIAAISFASGGEGSAGVSQNINVIYHAPATPGDKLRLINTSTTIGKRAWSARVEIWDVTHRRLVASATQIKMDSSRSRL